MSSIAVINAGSSSIKFAVFHAAANPALLLRGKIEGIGAMPSAKLSDGKGNLLVEEGFQEAGFDHAAATQAMMRLGSQMAPRKRYFGCSGTVFDADASD